MKEENNRNVKYGNNENKAKYEIQKRQHWMLVSNNSNKLYDNSNEK